MATERQIAANRANASKSTGPRTRAGRIRASGNATVHGLTASLLASTALAKQVDQLAREIAGSTDDPILWQYARDAAYAEIDLARIRRVRVAVIERAALGSVDTPPLLKADRKVLGGDRTPTSPKRDDPKTTTPSEEPEGTAEAVRRALPELTKLVRYESRAAARRDAAIRQISRRAPSP